MQSLASKLGVNTGSSGGYRITGNMESNRISGDSGTMIQKLVFHR